MRSISLCLFIALLSGCASHQHFTPAGPPLNLSQKLGAVPAETKVFLIAGSHNAANFGEEIVQQKKLWLARGLKESEIACYYAVPCEHSISADYQQYKALAPELAKCFPASTKTLKEHVAAVAKNAPPFVYFYFTAHGRNPNLSQGAPEMERFTLEMDTTPSGMPLHATQAFNAVKGGESAENYYLTTPALRAMLKSFPKATKKVVVLQGCFSGGFIRAAGDKFSEQNPLNGIPNLDVIAASAEDRTSFGCGVGTRLTYFGGAFLESLSQHPGKPDAIAWKSVYNRAFDQVKALEQTQGITDINKSLPAYLKN